MRTGCSAPDPEPSGYTRINQGSKGLWSLAAPEGAVTTSFPGGILSMAELERRVGRAVANQVLAWGPKHPPVGVFDRETAPCGWIPASEVLPEEWEE
jgi:hypothetical protein